MRRIGSSPFAFPSFSGATRQLVLVNLCTYFMLAIVGLVSADSALNLFKQLSFLPPVFLHGALWQPLTYSFIHAGIIATLFELLSLWFLAGFLEGYHNANWVLWLYAVSVLGTAAAALVIYGLSGPLGFALPLMPLYGCFGGIFGLLVAIGVLYGDMEFLMFFVIGIKAGTWPSSTRSSPSPCSSASSASTLSRSSAAHWPACYLCAVRHAAAWRSP